MLEVCGDGVIINVPDSALKEMQSNGSVLVLREVECLARYVAMLLRAEFMSLGMLCLGPWKDLLSHRDEPLQACSVTFLDLLLVELSEGRPDNGIALNKGQAATAATHPSSFPAEAPLSLAPLFSDAEALMPIVRTLQQKAVPSSADAASSCAATAARSLRRLCASRPFRECTLGRGAWLLTHLEVQPSREVALTLWQQLLDSHLSFLASAPPPLAHLSLRESPISSLSPTTPPLEVAAHAVCGLDIWNLSLRWVEMRLTLEGDWTQRRDPASPTPPRNSPNSSTSDAFCATVLPTDTALARLSARGLAQGMLASVMRTPEHALCAMTPGVAIHAMSLLGVGVAHDFLKQAGEVLMVEGCARLLKHMREAEVDGGVDNDMSMDFNGATSAASQGSEGLKSRWPDAARAYTARFHGGTTAAGDAEDLYAYREQPLALAHLFGAAFRQVSDAPRLELVRHWLRQLEQFEVGLSKLKGATDLDDCCRLMQHSILLRLRCLQPLLEVAGQRRSKGWALLAPDEAWRFLLLLVRFATLPPVRRKVPLLQAVPQGDGSCIGIAAYSSGWAPPATGGDSEPILVLGDAMEYILWLLQTLSEALGREMPPSGTKPKEGQPNGFSGLVAEVARLCDARRLSRRERQRLAQVLLGPAAEVNSTLLGADDAESRGAGPAIEAWTVLEGVSTTPLAQSVVAKSTAMFDW
jgi:hypothetical protein